MISETLNDIITTNEAYVVGMTDDRKIVKTALKLSYYVAMLDAAEDEPLDDAEQQKALVELFNDIIQNTTETFQRLVNAKL